MTAPRHVDAVVLRRRPSGLPRPDDLALSEVEVPTLGDDEVRVSVLDLSLDPYLRSTLAGRHLDDAPVAVGDVVPGRSVGRVVASRAADIPEGALVLAETGWRAEAVVAAKQTTLVRVPAGVPASAALGALGMPGLTAYAAIVRHLTPRPGETVVVGAATGGVGSVAGALARDRGARTVAIVGDDDKAADAIDRLGYAAAVVRGRDGWEDALAAACADGIDGYLHMGDMPTLHAVVRRLAPHARVSLCGLMDQYNDGPPTTLPVAAIIMARATVHGMVVYDHGDLVGAQLAEVAALLADGSLTLHEERHEGLASAPAAFARLMAGRNRGQVVVTGGR
ncbi:NADP-dependent oxidoreductase [Mumia sp.]|uniref:MDR family NADP-dependent oxidoreductase n=1 Tax=Mumia sp. TaxID=1965300 RepID=UPI002620507D|nr:NADP-dependent oxidoreductase [Mumia sp.]MDD9347989.1 NADP-dependent oxidoreductase [Mumia sp.]